MNNDLAFWNTRFGNLKTSAARFEDEKLTLYLQSGYAIEVWAENDKLVFHYDH